MADIGKNLGGFFKAQDDLHQAVAEEEKKSKTVVKRDVSLDQQALDRVLAQRRMEQMEVELRETLVYQSPPELGAVYTDFIAMRKVIREEQEQARLEHEKKERLKSWQRRQVINAMQDKALYLVAVAIVFLYLHLMFVLIVLDRRARWGF